MAKIGVEVEGEGYSFFVLNIPLNRCDILDNCIGRLFTNFQISANLSKKVRIFPQIVSTSTLTLKVEMKVDTFFEKIRTFLLRVAELSLIHI